MLTEASCFSPFWMGVSVVVFLFCLSHHCVWSMCLYVGVKIIGLYIVHSIPMVMNNLSELFKNSHTQRASVILGHDSQGWDFWLVLGGVSVFCMWYVSRGRLNLGAVAAWPVEYGEVTLCQFSGLGTFCLLSLEMLILGIQPPCWEETQPVL